MLSDEQRQALRCKVVFFALLPQVPVWTQVVRFYLHGEHKGERCVDDQILFPRRHSVFTLVLPHTSFFNFDMILRLTVAFVGLIGTIFMQTTAVIISWQYSLRESESTSARSLGLMASSRDNH